MFTYLLASLVLIPILGFIGCALLPRTWERAISTLAMSAILLEFAVFLAVGYQWLSTGISAAHPLTLYASDHYTLSFDLNFDDLAAAFLGTATVLTALVFTFSKYYMHREPGFKRFYSTVFLFFTGLTLLILANNFEVLFLGWEFIGISSVLLIAFYRDRFLPARNALKVFSVYRIADAFLLAAIWYAHHVFEKSVHFSELSQVVAHHGSDIVLLGLLLLGAALIKSAQFPFSYWLPRAMEGPTTSTAIFYGALSVHMGLFLLLRTFPLYEDNIWLRIVIALVGLVTAVIATAIARVQSSIKAQIAYASITQIGIMFIELAAGLHGLVILHFVSNAALRTYQLLISPSVVSYLVHDQFFYFVQPLHKIKNTLIGKIRATIYILSIKEWNMNALVSRFLWAPLKRMGRAFAWLDKPFAQLGSLAVFMVIAALAVFTGWTFAFSTAAIMLSIIFLIRAYTTKNAATTAWNLIMLGQLFGALFLGLASHDSWKYVAVYTAGILAAFVTGHICLQRLKAKGEPSVLQNYQGSIFSFPGLGNLFFIVCLVFMVFPISPAFVAQEILLSGIPGDHGLQIVLFCVSYLLLGVSVMRLYTKVFFGPSAASYHEKADKSS